MVPAPATSPPLPATATSGRRGLRSRAWTTQVQSKATPAPREGGEGLRLRGESLPGTWPGADVHFGKALLAGHCREEVGAVGTGGHTGSERPSGAGSAAGGADGTRGGGPGLWVGGAVSPPPGRRWAVRDTERRSRTLAAVGEARPPERDGTGASGAWDAALLWPRLSARPSSHTADTREPSEQGRGPEGHAAARGQGTCPRLVSETPPGGQSGG